MCDHPAWHGTGTHDLACIQCNLRYEDKDLHIGIHLDTGERGVWTANAVYPYDHAED